MCGGGNVLALGAWTDRKPMSSQPMSRQIRITDPAGARRHYFDHHRNIHEYNSVSIELYLSIAVRSAGLPS
jgi:hypothetical protein